MLDLTQLLPFTLATLIIILSPGADSFALLRISHSQGIKAGMRALWGINLGNSLQAALMISGVGLVVSKFEPAIFTLKILGGFYMAYLALLAARSAWRSRAQTSVDQLGGTALIWQTVIVYGAVKLSETIKSAKFNLVMDVICAIAFTAIAVFIFAEI